MPASFVAAATRSRLIDGHAARFQNRRGRAMKRISHYINGRIVEGGSGRCGPVFNPATGEQTAEVDFASESEVDRVVAAAVAAWPAWRAMSLARRSEIMFK